MINKGEQITLKVQGGEDWVTMERHLQCSQLLMQVCVGWREIMCVDHPDRVSIIWKNHGIQRTGRR